MEEKKTTVDTADTADTNPQVDLVDKEPIADAMEATPAATGAPASNRALVLTIASVVVVVVALVGGLYVMEREGRVDTNIFSGVLDAQEGQAEVAIVNGETVTEAQLAVARTQLEQAAAAQGADPTDPAIQASIRSQALDLVIGTTLLTQAAQEQGVEVTDEEVSERLATIEADAGGAEALAGRMQEFGISTDALESDVRSELIITKLLDTEVAQEDTSVSEEEINSTYEEASATGAELPPLEEVRDQIVAQLEQAKSQAVIEEYVTQLRADADIEMIE
jgi:FKBP-type peptidyl-prolyl cis-trans isomerase (trigger factor)